MSICAKRHANADLIGALSYGVSGHAIQTDRCQQQGHNSEQSGKAGHRALLIEGESNLLLHSPHADNRQVGIDFSKSLGKQRLELASRNIGHQHDSSHEV